MNICIFICITIPINSYNCVSAILLLYYIMYSFKITRPYFFPIFIIIKFYTLRIIFTSKEV